MPWAAGTVCETREVPIYHMEARSEQAIFPMGYASAKIVNPALWKEDRRTKKVVEIDLVFTQYPKKKEDWRTNYDTLLYDRIREVMLLDADIANNPSIKWNLILQTSCQNEAEAKNLFHGAVIRYKVKLSNRMMQELAMVKGIITGQEAFTDSVVFKVFERNREWTNMVIVNDWTGSMYQYGAQVVLWHRLFGKSKSVRQLVFFNDGNYRRDKDKVIGETGGIYTADPQNTREIIQTMREVMLQGTGGDIEENDLEAVLFAQQQYDNSGELILVADNHSDVRDMVLLSQISRPVRIILCGVEKDKPIHPHYLEIARKTKGSLHTIDQDIMSLSEVQNGQAVEISGFRYHFNGQEFMAAR